MIRLKSESAAPPWRHPFLRVMSKSRALAQRHPVLRGALLLFLLGVAALSAERFWGQWAVSNVRQRMAAKGEIYDAGRIWPQPSAQGVAFSNQLQQTVARLPAGLSVYGGQLSAIVVQEPGIGRRGSQEPNPPPAYERNRLGTWKDLEAQIRQAQPALQSLHGILRDPPSDMGYDILPKLEKVGIPNFVNVRVAAQALAAAAVFNLHQRDLAGAKDDLVALAAFTRAYKDDPTLVSFMVRIAILGLSIDTAWDALQADGWTDGQLAELQHAFQSEGMLAQMPRTMEAERASRLFEFDWFSSHSYLAWVARYEAIYESFGQKLTVNRGVLATRYFREWVGHPLWKFAWANEERLGYLGYAQQELDIMREVAKTGSGRDLRRRMDSLHTGYHPPVASWRFYLVLPLHDRMLESPGDAVDKRRYPYPDFTRAWSTTMKNLTLCQMLTAAISLKRYELRHGKPPAGLDALVPELVSAVPRDFMDGQPLRYKIRSDGSYCLYSVADDAQDDHGDPVPHPDDQQRPSAWNGRDWVWPRAALPVAGQGGQG